MKLTKCCIALAFAGISSAPAFALLPQQTANENTQEAEEAVERIVIHGRAQTLYRERESGVATRTNTPIEEIPQSVQILNEELINDQAARQITDLYRSISGVNSFSYSGVTFRGFRQDEILYDGVRGDPFNGFAVPQLFNIEQIQVLKGPSGAMFGSGQPGGIINYVTKKPTAVAERAIKLGAGNYDYLQGSVELSGPLNDAASQRYRAAYYYDNEKPFRYNTEQTNKILDLGYAFDVGDLTEVILQFTDYEQDYQGARLRGVPVDNDGNFVTEREWNHNEASDFQTLNAKVYQARINHEFSLNWRGDLTMRHYDNIERQNYHEPRGLVDANYNLVSNPADAVYTARQFRNQYRDNQATSVTANLIGDVTVGGIEHTLLVGAETYSAENTFIGSNANPGEVPFLEIVNPVYGLTSGPYSTDLETATPRTSDTQRDGFYIQDQISLNEKANILVGVRYDQFDDESGATQFDDGDVTYRVGGTYQFTDWVRAYALYGTGFLPQSASQQDPAVGGPFEPEQSDIIELGARWSLADDAIRINTAVYEINRENILQATDEISDDGRTILGNVGKVRSRGFEIDVLGDLTDRWVINANYAYNDARVVETAPGQGITNAVGDRFVNAPLHQLGIWTRFELAAINSSISGGMDYVSDQISFSGQRVKPYTVFDLSWQTEFEQWLFQINVKNVFDKVYATSGFLSRTGHFPGEPRRIYTSIKYRF
ncbi:TonB-dependent siderophore receptor [Pseudidiomarina insulisalsae]|uniref:TonB-dependent siderophore receptor n=1 Tax=Pseudidiomarina insulisalsae TaxID=575789 RepID=A0A432YPQ8_9GAMM|nr:TonB-dependent receptor [Pseudidiomarina insulisalsae]RUO63108.1 TonB-dependent siderophore receptor [Pseudidiomarina insulisalsae]